MTKKVGFNFLWMYTDNAEKFAPVNPYELDLIAEEGFNFVRIPTSYLSWCNSPNYSEINEAVFDKLDNYINEVNKRGMHCCFNVHRGPGYCINSPERETHNLWKDKEPQDAFVKMWEYFTNRYKGISSEKLSFDLINEPASIPPTHPCTRDDHEKIIRRTINAIHAIDPSRQIVIDGFDGGGLALPELKDVDAIHSGRGYFPMEVSHYHAPWCRDYIEDKPEYPGYVKPGKWVDIDVLREYYRPWAELEKQGVKVHIGEFGCYSKIENDLALRWLNDLITIFNEHNWGYSMWNFKGDFGVIEHGRPGTVYEDYHGLKVDRAMMEIMKSGLKK